MSLKQKNQNQSSTLVTSWTQETTLPLRSYPEISQPSSASASRARFRQHSSSSLSKLLRGLSHVSAVDLYIIAAGNGSRMAVNVPKALVLIVDEPCLTTTLQQIGHKFRKVFVVTNEDVQHQWAAYFNHLSETYPELSANVINIPIRSGLGDGHAVLWGFNNVSDNEPKDPTLQWGLRDDVVIAWGDVFFPQAEIIDELLSKQLTSGLIPAVSEKTPYVSLLTDEHMGCMSADFSKYGENHPTGFHDQSVFRFKRSELRRALKTLHAAFWKNGRYITPGGELSLLHAFHFMYNTLQPARVYETDYPTLSFNTVAEVAAIQTEIDTKWKHKFRK